MFTHIVLFKLKDPSPALLERTREVLLSMQGRVPSLVDIEVGFDLLHSERSYDLALVTRFENRAGFEAYREHPYHRDPVLAHMHAVAASAVTVDFDAEAAGGEA